MAGENKVPCHTLDRMSGLEALRLLRGFQGEPPFSPHILLFSKTTSKTIKELPKVS
jgi:hypothetical protein